MFKEKFDLNILQRQEFYDCDKELTQLYDLLSLKEINKKPQTQNVVDNLFSSSNPLSPSSSSPFVSTSIPPSSSVNQIADKRTHMPRIKSPVKQQIQQPKPEYPMSSILNPPIKIPVIIPRQGTPPPQNGKMEV